MARQCAICVNDLTKKVRNWSDEGKGPLAISEILSRYHGMTLTTRQIAYHCKHHDPDAGTYPIQRAAAVAARKEAVELKEELGKELQEVKTLADKMESVLNKLLDAGEHLDAEKVAKMSPLDLVKMMQAGANLAIQLKKVEIDERKARHDMSFEMDAIRKMMGRVSTKRVRHVQE